jgi:hypothetical protein
MNNLIFFTLCTFFLVILLARLITWQKKTLFWNRLKNLTISKNQMVIVAGLLLIGTVFLSLRSYLNSLPTIKGKYVRVADGATLNVYPVLGPVKRVSIIDWDFENRFGEIEKTLWLSGETYFFDEKGQNTKLVSHENSTQQESLSIDKGITITTKFTADGKITERYKNLENGELGSKAITTFNDQGKYLRYSHYNGTDGSLNGTTEFSIDRDDLEKYKFIYLHTTTTNYEHTVKYWGSGKHKEWKLIHSENGQVLNREFYKYDSNGLLIHHYAYGETGKLTIDKYFERDESGKLIRISHQIPGRTYTPKYLDFDEYGNWREVVWYEDGMPIWLWVREIEYYLTDDLVEEI